MQVPHRFAASSAVFDDKQLVSCAGLVPVMTLADQTALPQLAEKIRFTFGRIRSGAANPSSKLTNPDRRDARRSRQHRRPRPGAQRRDEDAVSGVYAPSTIGTLLREFTFGHARQLESVLREHVTSPCQRVDLLPGAGERAFIDIDPLRPVYGHAEQGASYGHTKINGKQILRKGLSPLVTKISTEHAAPVITGPRLRAGKANSLRQNQGVSQPSPARR